LRFKEHTYEVLGSSRIRYLLNAAESCMKACVPKNMCGQKYRNKLERKDLKEGKVTTYPTVRWDMLYLSCLF